MFYVYVYLDPRKPGQYSYDGLECSFLYEPIYVGKGKGNRINEHNGCIKQNKTRSNYNVSFYNKYRKIYRETGRKPLSLKLFENLTEDKSFQKEIKLIQLIGRKDLKLGPLCNLTDGGEGDAGRILSEEHKEKLRVSFTGENNPMYGKIGSMQGKHHTEEAKEKMRNFQKFHHPMKDKCHSEKSKEKISDSIKGDKHPLYGKKHSEESKRKMSESAKRRHQKINEGDRTSK